MIYGGLTYRAVDIQRPDLFLDVLSSPYEPADYRGRDDIALGRPGRVRRNRLADRRVIRLNGWTRGIGTTIEERRESWNDAEAELLALLDPSMAPGDLTVLAPYLGLVGGSLTIEAVGLNWLAGDVLGSMSFRRWSIELEAVGNPPDWTNDESSS
jgi:hypothetical protein